MGKVEEMSELDPYHELINTVLNEKEVIIFLGAGASMEGDQGENKFPGYKELMDNVAERFGVKPQTWPDRINNFLIIVKKWKNEENLSAKLSEFLEGEPGSAHYYFAALSIALFGKSRTLLYLTTNFDDLITKAFQDLERNPERRFRTINDTIRPNIPYPEFQQMIGNMDIHLKEGRPFILKLFGDLNTKSPILSQEDMNFTEPVNNQLIRWMEKPMIIIGYSFSDKIIRRLLTRADSAFPVFIINPDKTIHESFTDLDRIRHIDGYFSTFVDKLFKILRENHSSIAKKVDKILQSLNLPPKSMTFEQLTSYVKKNSLPSLIRAEDKLPKIINNNKIFHLKLIERQETGPNFDYFLKNNKPLLVIVGGSGSGKSTLLYKKAKKSSKNKYLTLFYDVHHIQTAGSLLKRFTEDFKYDEKDLKVLIRLLDKLLSLNGKKLLIMIDGLNEATHLNPLQLKMDIEKIGEILPDSIKIVYSCRTVYWDTYIKSNAPLPVNLYHGSMEFLLYNYSEKETERAFCEYEKLFEFKGGFESLNKELKEKVRDPLMLRMLSEGYRNKQLPTFAPAVKIFKNYEDSLRKKFKDDILVEFLEELVVYKLNEEEIRKEKSGNDLIVNDQFDRKMLRRDPVLSILYMEQLVIKRKSPITLLEDEGIISSLDTVNRKFRFTYDRFFEYLLGKEIGERIEKELSNRPGGVTINNFNEILSNKIVAFQRSHFSFHQALKSEVIRQNITNTHSIWSFFDETKVKFLLFQSPDNTIRQFTKSVLRELTFETDQSTFNIIEKVADNALESKRLALEIAPDSPKIIPILIEGIFSGNKSFIRCCVDVLKVTIGTYLSKDDFEDLLLTKIGENDEFTSKHAMGTIYYSAVIFSVEDRAGARSDPAKTAKKFWKKLLMKVSKGNLNYEALNAVQTCFKDEFVRLVKDEGPFFFAEEARIEGMDYLWTNTPLQIRELSLRLVPLIMDENLPFSSEIEEIIWFFGSELKDWEKRSVPDNTPIFAYKFEFLLAQWLLIQRSKTQFKAVKNILERFVNRGFWAGIDFALCTMEFIIKIVYPENEKIRDSGFKAMESWTDKFERENEMFFDTLKAEDPFSVNYNPVGQAAGISLLYFTPREAPIPFLEKRLKDKDLRKVRLALLSIRYLWKESPGKALTTLQLVVNSNDKQVRKWLDKILREIYSVYPRLVEDFLWKTKMDQCRVRSIRSKPAHQNKDVLRNDGSPLLKAFFLKLPKQRKLVMNWYKKMLTARSLENFCEELIDSLFVDVVKK